MAWFPVLLIGWPYWAFLHATGVAILSLAAISGVVYNPLRTGCGWILKWSVLALLVAMVRAVVAYTIHLWNRTIIMKELTVAIEN